MNTDNTYNAAVALLVNNEKKILLQLRDNKEEILYPNMWGGFGGGIEKNESPTEGILRELLEEINYNPKKIILLDIIPFPHGKLFIFSGKIDLSVEEIILNEGQKVDYFVFEQLKDINIVPVLRDYIYLNRDKIFK